MYIDATVSENNNAIDEQLISRIAVKDKKAFDDLITRHLGSLYAVAYRMRFSKHDAEDIVQEAMMRVWQRADSWNKEAGASVRTWMYTIAHNLCIDFKRKNKRPPLELMEEPADKSPSAVDRIEENEAREVVAEGLASLPENQKMAIILCHYEKFSNAEAAEVMNTTVKAVESLLVRARKTLHDRLEKKRNIFGSE